MSESSSEERPHQKVEINIPMNVNLRLLNSRVTRANERQRCQQPSCPGIESLFLRCLVFDLYGSTKIGQLLHYWTQDVSRLYREFSAVFYGSARSKSMPGWTSPRFVGAGNGLDGFGELGR